MRSDEDAFIEAIGAAPEDEAARLVYADWLEERDDPRGAYLRAEVTYFRRKEGRRNDRKLSALLKQVDPVWAAMVSRPPFGIAVPGLTFRGKGPKVTRARLSKIEAFWGEPLPPDYAAFLLRYNGGRPSKPYLCSDVTHENGDTGHYCGAVRFYSTRDINPGGGPLLTMSVVDLFGGILPTTRTSGGWSG
jgi:uncharacterized protein (TIGR02996 family)